MSPFDANILNERICNLHNSFKLCCGLNLGERPETVRDRLYDNDIIYHYHKKPGNFKSF